MQDLIFKREVAPFTNYIQLLHAPDMGFADKIHNIILKEANKYEDITEAWQDYDLLSSWDYPEIKELKTMFEASVMHYLKSRGLRPLEYKMQSWCNIRGKNSRHPAHIHEFTSIILNYYVSTPAGSGIVFHNPVKAMAYIPWAEKYAPYEHTVWTEPGMLVVSPGWLIHEVPYTTDNGDRISISVNIVDLEVEKCP